MKKGRKIMCSKWKHSTYSNIMQYNNIVETNKKKTVDTTIIIYTSKLKNKAFKARFFLKTKMLFIRNSFKIHLNVFKFI